MFGNVRYEDETIFPVKSNDSPLLRAVERDAVTASHIAILTRILQPWAAKNNTDNELQRTVDLLILNYSTPALALCSSRDQLISIGLSPDIATYLASLKTILQQALLAEMAERPQFPDFTAVQTFLQSLIGFNSEESFIVLYMDGDLRLITYSQFDSGNSSTVSIQTRNIVRRSLECNAQAIIISHNHPSGNPNPSWSDRVFTRELKQQLDVFNISLIDHIIVSWGKYESLLHGEEKNNT